MKTHSHVLFIGGHDDTFDHYEGLPARFTCIQRQKSLGPKLKALTEKIHIVDDFDIKEVVELASDLHFSDPFDYIVSFTEDGLLPSATAANALGVPGIDLEACRLCIDKSLMRGRLVGTRFEVVHKICREVDDAAAFLSGHPDGVILKPFSGAGSEGVCVARSLDELRASFEWQPTENRALLVEPYFVGRMFSVETLTIRGHHEVVAITSVELEEGTLVPIQHLLPSPSYPEIDQDRVAEFCLALLKEIGYNHGPCHIELKANAQGITLIEINNRVGGDLLGHLAKLTRGINMYRETIEYMFEGFPNAESRAQHRRFKYGASRSFRYPINVPAAKAALAKVNVETFGVEEGAEAAARFDSADDRLGPVVFTSNDLQEFEDAISSMVELARAASASI